MNVSFRVAKSSDVPFITQVYNQNIPKRTVTADLRPVSVSKELKIYYQHNPDRPLWIIEQNSNRVGWISLESFYGRPAYHATVEISIYIDDHFQRHGIGRTALKFISTQARSLGIHTILVFIFSVNIPSQKLFESAGFVRYGHLPKIADMKSRVISLDIWGKKF